MTDAELFELNEVGFIPGPGEQEEAFLARVERAKKRFEKGAWIPACEWDWVRENLDRLANVKPLYICAFYSNRGLMPWQGGASWIEGREVHSIQLRKNCWGLCSQEELLAHEAIHAVRSGFEEDVWEEFFAYMTSEKRWRRVLGPIVERPWEVWPLLGLSLVGCWWGAAIWVGLGFGRLIRRHRILARAGERISESVKEERWVRAILFRLTGEEIVRLASGEKFDKLAEQQSCLRWRVIKQYR
jgi:hypothetical protein